MCTEGLSPEEVQQGKDLLHRHRGIFSTGDTDIGLTSSVKHRIELSNSVPFKQKHRRVPPSMYEEVRNHLQQLLASGVIRRSHSPWASNVVLVRKKDGKLRMCIDYRQLNERTIKDSYALPRIEEILEALSGNKYFTVLDMKSGYHQVELEETHKERTAFTVGPLGFYEFSRLPFGLANSPATYQRLMEECLGDLNLQVCFIYLDDVIIFSDTFEEHLRRLELVLSRFKEAGLKLSPKKCSFFMRKVKYVGHIVSENGIEPDPDKIDKVRDWPTPTTPEEVRKFLGFVGYYRRFIPLFAKIARPLTNLMPPSNAPKRRGKKQVTPQDWQWKEEEETAFQTLKSLLTTYPILAYPDFQQPFELHTDACLLGLGAVLYQEKDGVKRVIAYASRGLSKSERNYPVHKLEFLALKWAICEKFHDYLYGNHFTAFTDNNPLTYVLSSAKLDATSQRWIAALAVYNFNILYRPGVSNADADGLSRLPGVTTSDDDRCSILPDTIKAICRSTQGTPVVESLPTSTAALDDLPPDPQLRSIDMVKAQREDDDLKWWLPHINDGVKPDKDSVPASPAFQAMYRNFDRLTLIDGVIYRQVTLNGQETNQLVVPRSKIPIVLKLAHDDMGHQGRDKTVSLVRDRFFWCGMVKDVEEYIKGCDRCIRRKSSPGKAELVGINTYQPLELVCMDFLCLETSKGGFQNILVITDHFTRYAVAVPTKNQTARTTAEAFLNNFVVHYGLPQRIHSDQGANFESRLIKEICEITGMTKSRTTPYHAMGNGLCERMNRSLLGMLGTLDPSQKRDWKSHVATLVHAYNCTRQESTGFSPYYLLFGREPNLPMDIVFGLNRNQPEKSLHQYAEGLRDNLENAYKLAATNSGLAKERQKENYDKRVKSAVVHPGDIVLVKIVAFDGKHKLSDRWEEDPYLVLSQPNQDIPVYVVQKQNGQGRKRTLHRNLLLPINTAGTRSKPPEKTKPVPAPRITRKSLRRQTAADPSVSIPSEPSEVTTDSEDEVLIEVVTRMPEDNIPLDVGEGDGATEERDESEASEPVEEDGDAHPSTAEISGEEDEQAADETLDEPTPPPRSPRRSQRNRRPPEWYRSGDYVMSVQRQPDWIQRAEYLKGIISSGVLPEHRSDMTEALIKIITSSV